jgi:hypothetical protein
VVGRKRREDSRNFARWSSNAPTHARSRRSCQRRRTVNGKFGARYFGFYGTAGFQLRTITITCKEPFAIGEFGIAKG